jgi:LPXTG-motif cell wall-anchored protein
VTLHEGQKVGALEGAEFKLYVPKTGGTYQFKDSEGNTVAMEPYTNSILTSGKKIVSDGTGRLTIQGESKPGIRGLDLGTYYLVEEKAPTGYIKCQNAVKLEILAPDDADHWATKTYTEERNGYTYTWDVKELKKYEVKINGVKTAEYTFINEDEDPDSLGSSTDTADKGDTITITGKVSEGYIGRPGATVNAGNGKIVNTQGAELPATGGPGTMYFYLAGMFLLILAGTGFVLKRRMA